MTIATMTSFFRRNWQPVLFYILVFVGWEMATRTGLVRAFILPAPSTIAGTIVSDWDQLSSNIAVTAVEILIGYTVGSLLGFLMALCIFYSEFLKRIIYPGALFMQTVPKIALAPLFIIWFGVGQASIVAITALICLFPVLINAVVGLESVDDHLIELMDSVSATGWQKFRMIRLPAALPSVMAGLEVASTLAVVGALVGEFVGARAGLGYQILISNSRLATDEVFAAIFAVAALGLMFFGVTKLTERLLLRGRTIPTAK